MKMRSFNRIVAVMLCVACLIPNFTGLAEAIGLASAAPRSVQTNSKWVPVSDPFAAGEIPAYQTVGAVTPNALVTDCGNGVTRDQAKSYLKMVTGTTDLEFLAFKTAMVNAGFSITAARNLPGSQDYNLFYRFLSPNKNYVVTAYYAAKLGEAHIVADTGEDAVKSFSTGFVYDSQTNEVAQPMMTLYGLSMSPNGYDISTTTSYGTGVQAQAGEVESYYREESGNTVDSRLYVSRDRRNDVLWEFNLTNPTTNEALVYTEGKPLFGGSENEFFYRSIWYKGTQSDAHPFWALTESTADGSYRFLQPNRAALFNDVVDPNAVISAGEGSHNIRVEFFDEVDGIVRPDEADIDAFLAKLTELDII